MTPFEILAAIKIGAAAAAKVEANEALSSVCAAAWWTLLCAASSRKPVNPEKPEEVLAASMLENVMPKFEKGRSSLKAWKDAEAVVEAQLIKFGNVQEWSRNFEEVTPAIEATIQNMLADLSLDTVIQRAATMWQNAVETRTPQRQREHTEAAVAQAAEESTPLSRALRRTQASAEGIKNQDTSILEEKILGDLERKPVQVDRKKLDDRLGAWRRLITKDDGKTREH